MKTELKIKISFNLKGVIILSFGLLLSCIAGFFYIETSEQNKVGKNLIKNNLEIKDAIGVVEFIKISYLNRITVSPKSSNITYKVKTSTGVYEIRVFIENISVCEFSIFENKRLLKKEKFYNEYDTCMKLSAQQAKSNDPKFERASWIFKYP